jgi:hypothetical protein
MGTIVFLDLFRNIAKLHRLRGRSKRHCSAVSLPRNSRGIAASTDDQGHIYTIEQFEVA